MWSVDLNVHSFTVFVWAWMSEVTVILQIVSSLSLCVTELWFLSGPAVVSSCFSTEDNVQLTPAGFKRRRFFSTVRPHWSPSVKNINWAFAESHPPRSQAPLQSDDVLKGLLHVVLWRCFTSQLVAVFGDGLREPEPHNLLPAKSHTVWAEQLYSYQMMMMMMMMVIILKPVQYWASQRAAPQNQSQTAKLQSSTEGRPVLLSSQKMEIVALWVSVLVQKYGVYLHSYMSVCVCVWRCRRGQTHTPSIQIWSSDRCECVWITVNLISDHWLWLSKIIERHLHVHLQLHLIILQPGFVLWFTELI